MPIRRFKPKRKPSPRTEAYVKRFSQLVRRFPLCTLQTEKQYDSACHISGSLVDPRKKKTPAERDYLELLSQKIHNYQEKHWPSSPMPPLRMLASLMENNCLNAEDLANILGCSAESASQAMSGEREMLASEIAKLADRFCMSASAFVPTKDRREPP